MAALIEISVGWFVKIQMKKSPGVYLGSLSSMQYQTTRGSLFPQLQHPALVMFLCQQGLLLFSSSFFPFNKIVGMVYDTQLRWNLVTRLLIVLSSLSDCSQELQMMQSNHMPLTLVTTFGKSHSIFTFFLIYIEKLHLLFKTTSVLNSENGNRTPPPSQNILILNASLFITLLLF